MATPKQKDIPADAIAAQVDELGALETRVLPFRSDLARIEMLKKAIRGHFEASPAALAFEAKGEHFTCCVGPCAVERSINPLRLIKAIGSKAYAKLCRPPTFAALEAEIAPDIIAGAVTSAHTGSRSLKTFARAA